jgi:transcriptional regulator with XRE-family HTH domain
MVAGKKLFTGSLKTICYNAVKMTIHLQRVMIMLFSQQLAAIRKKRGYTQQALADKIGIHVTQIKRYEAGAARPTLEVFRNIVLALNVSADTMLFDSDERGPDEELRLHFEAVSKLDPREKYVIKELIEGMLIKHDAKRWTQPQEAHLQ